MAASPGMPPPAEAVEETPAARAELMRGEAAGRRTGAHQARAEAGTLVEAARAQAARLVADAEAQARQLDAEACAADRQAAALEETAGRWAAVDELGGRAREADERALLLAAEAEDVTAQDEALARRVAELGEEREETTRRLAAAREAGDVDQVGSLRARLAAVDEVAGVLAGQRGPLQARLQAIGTADGIGELAGELKTAARLRGEQRRLLNELQPDRIEALADELEACLLAQVAELSAPAPQMPRTQLLRTPGGTAAFTSGSSR